MAQRSRQGKYSEAEARDILARRLEEERPDIEDGILQKVISSLEDEGSSIPEYVVGLRASIPAAVGFGITAIRDGTNPPPLVPVELLSQARLAARYQVPIDGVLRRYIAGRSLLDRALLSQHRRDRRFGQDILEEMAESVALAFEDLAAAISREYSQVALAKTAWSSSRKLSRVERLLAGDPASPLGLEYSLQLTHFGIAGEGPAARAALAVLARSLEAQLLVVSPFPEVIWAWLGFREPPNHRTLKDAVAVTMNAHEPIGIGAAEGGIAGWKRTHDQARIAVAHATKRQQPTHYADVAVAHSIWSDPLLHASLHRHYLAPLESARDGGTKIRDALRAYFEAGCNCVAAAGALGLSRRTVSTYLAQAEDLLGQPILRSALELQLALTVFDGYAG